MRWYRSKETYTYPFIKFIHSTDKARLIKFKEGEFWIPKKWIQRHQFHTDKLGGTLFIKEYYKLDFKIKLK